MQFRATLQLAGKTATGITVPEHIIASLGGGNHPPVRVTIADHTYQTTVARMNGEFKFPVSSAIREQAGVAAGDELDVTIQLDTGPREVTIPADLLTALDREPDAKTAFGKLSYTNQKRHVLAIEGAKTPETRQRRIAKTLGELRSASHT